MGWLAHALVREAVFEALFVKTDWLKPQDRALVARNHTSIIRILKFRMALDGKTENSYGPFKIRPNRGLSFRPPSGNKNGTYRRGTEANWFHGTTKPIEKT